MKFLISNILNRLKYGSCKTRLNWYLIFIALTVSISPIFAQTAKEYEIKSVLLEKISRFIKWPENSNGDNRNLPFVIGVLGKDPFEAKLDRIFSTHPIQGRQVQIKYYSTLQEIKPCNILFISGSEKTRISEIIKYFNAKPVLLVGDTKGFLESGVHVFFYINNSNELRFKINVDALRRSNLTANSFLLDYANKE